MPNLQDENLDTPKPAEPSAVDVMIDAWHRQHFAGMPVEVWNASVLAVADLKAKLAAKP